MASPILVTLSTLLAGIAQALSANLHHRFDQSRRSLETTLHRFLIHDPAIGKLLFRLEEGGSHSPPPGPVIVARATFHDDQLPPSFRAAA
jgi:hypothetical protein